MAKATCMWMERMGKDAMRGALGVISGRLIESAGDTADGGGH